MGVPVFVGASVAPIITCMYRRSFLSQASWWVRAHPRWAVALAVGASLMVHAGVMGVFSLAGMYGRPRAIRLTDIETELPVELDREPTPPPTPEPAPEPTPEPAPVAESTPSPETVVSAAPEAVPAIPEPFEVVPPATEAPTRLEMDHSPATPTGLVVSREPDRTIPPRPEIKPEPKPVSFAGLKSTRASRVIYVIDASGSMASTLAWAGKEVQHSVEGLDATQSFQVIVSRDVGGASRPDFFAGFAGMAEPTPLNRRRLAEWLDAVRAGGRSNPLTAINAAFALKPDLVILLTRSIKRTGGGEWGAGVDATLEALEKLNPRESGQLRRVVIKAVQFLEDDPTGLLQEVARRHGDGPGSYRVMTLEEIGK